MFLSFYYPISTTITAHYSYNHTSPQTRLLRIKSIFSLFSVFSVQGADEWVFKDHQINTPLHFSPWSMFLKEMAMGFLRPQSLVPTVFHSSHSAMACAHPWARRACSTCHITLPLASCGAV